MNHELERHTGLSSLDSRLIDCPRKHSNDCLREHSFWRLKLWCTFLYVQNSRQRLLLNLQRFCSIQRKSYVDPSNANCVMSVSAQQGYHPEVSDVKVFCVPMLSPQNTIPSWKMAGNDFPRQFLIKKFTFSGQKNYIYSGWYFHTQASGFKVKVRTRGCCKNQTVDLHTFILT